MNLLSIIVFSFSINIDNISAGIACGIKKINIGMLEIFIISVISALGTFFSMALGLILLKFFPLEIFNIIGAVMLIILGIYFSLEPLIHKKRSIKKETTTLNEFDKYIEILEDPIVADTNHSGGIDTKESVSLAIALVLNNFPLGISASITGMNIPLAVLLTFIFSMLTFSIGYNFGKGYLSRVLGDIAPIFSGILILLLGIHQLFS